MSEKRAELEAQLAALGEADVSETKVDLLNQLAWELGFDEVHRAGELAGEAHRLSDKLSYKKGMARSLLNQAVYHHFVAGFEKALDLAAEAHRLFVDVGDRVGEGDDATLDLIRPELGGGISLVKRFGDIPKIEGYPAQLDHLFMTLLVNAREAIDDTGAITFVTEPSKDYVTVAISDTGRGISRERIENLFDVGFSQKGARMRMHTGLASCYGVVQRHKGKIEVESDLGKGTTFRVLLPLKQT